MINSNISTIHSLKPPPCSQIDQNKGGEGGVKLLDPKSQKFSAPSAPIIMMDYQHFAIVILLISNCQEAPQAKLFSFLERFANDLPSKMIISKGKPQ